MSQFGTEGGKHGFDDLTREYGNSPTIENYLRLRRQHPDGEIEIATTGGIEFLFSQAEELRLNGIDPNLVDKVLDADLPAQAEMSLLLIERVIERDEIKRSGETHIVSRKRAISDTLVNYLIGTALDSMSWNDELEISPELIVLIKHQLGNLTSQYEIELERQERRSQAFTVALQILARGQTPTYRKVGRALGVQASTVMRWFPDRDFIAEMKTLVGSVKSASITVGKKVEHPCRFTNLEPIDNCN
jgi:hypothetical protein